MMARNGRDTHRLIIDGKVLKQLVQGCNEPVLLTEIFRLVRELAFKRITVAAFDAACEAMPCILWQPEYEDQRHLTVRTRDGDETVVSVARVLWTATHICSEQGEDLRGHEEVLHICDHNGATHTGRGACLNPKCLFRGDENTRNELYRVREMMRKRGLRKVNAA
jgi:hypothetical protein